MEDAVLQSMCVRVPRVHEVFDSCPPPQAPTTTTTTSSSSQVRNTRGSFKGTTGSNVPRQQREAHPASSSQYSTDASPMPSSRPLDSDMSDDGMFSPGDHMGHPQQPIITIPSSPTRVRHAPIVPARSGHASKELIVPGLHRNSVDRNIKYRTDVRLAREGTDPISRYKGITQLLSGLQRDFMRMGYENNYDKLPCETSSQMDLLTRVAEVGETLCMFGNMDQLLLGSNSGRAINARDYAFLLKTYCQAFWQLFQQSYIDTLPLTLADEFMSIRGLLMVRCETNDIIADQLIKNVGLESKSAGTAATIVNSSVVNSNPVNRVLAAPTNHVKNLAQAASKAMHMSQNKLGAIALGSVAGLWLLKRTGALGLIGLGGRDRRRAALLSEGSEEGSRRGRRHYGTRGLGKEERLLLAFEHVDKTWKELAKAQANAMLLENDWRLGKLRLAAPMEGPHPPGYQAVDMEGCDPRHFMHQQLGR